jgi:NAD(P)-dependent dehydrogenase (short-subunit alcohol dehydrogenase family)
MKHGQSDRLPRTFFTNKICLVTGGAQGLGWALAQALADRGARVFVGDISRESLDRARATLADLPFGDRVELAECDVSDGAAVKQWIEGVAARAGRIDVLVNNAAFVRWRDVVDLSPEDELRTMHVCFEGMLHGVRAVLPSMRQQGSGLIINIGSSVAKLLVGSSSACYAAAKSAIDAYTQLLDFELEGSGVRTLLVRPGAIAGTEFFSRNVSHTRMPRFADMLPVLTPPRMAKAILAAATKGRRVLDYPGYLRFMYWFAALAPRLMHRLMIGQARVNLGAVAWQYQPQTRPAPSVRPPSVER